MRTRRVYYAGARRGEEQWWRQREDGAAGGRRFRQHASQARRCYGGVRFTRSRYCRNHGVMLRHALPLLRGSSMALTPERVARAAAVAGEANTRPLCQCGQHMFIQKMAKCHKDVHAPYVVNLPVHVKTPFKMLPLTASAAGHADASATLSAMRARRRCRQPALKPACSQAIGSCWLRWRFMSLTGNAIFCPFASNIQNLQQAC